MQDIEDLDSMIMMEMSKEILQKSEDLNQWAAWELKNLEKELL